MRQTDRQVGGEEGIVCLCVSGVHVLETKDRSKGGTR